MRIVSFAVSRPAGKSHLNRTVRLPFFHNGEQPNRELKLATGVVSIGLECRGPTNILFYNMPPCKLSLPKVNSSQHLCHMADKLSELLTPWLFELEHVVIL